VFTYPAWYRKERFSASTEKPFPPRQRCVAHRPQNESTTPFACQPLLWSYLIQNGRPRSDPCCQALAAANLQLLQPKNCATVKQKGFNNRWSATTSTPWILEELGLETQRLRKKLLRERCLFTALLKFVHTGRALSRTITNSHQETDSGQARNPPDPHWCFLLLFCGVGALRCQY